MKQPYWLLMAGVVAIATIIGGSLASMNHSLRPSTAPITAEPTGSPPISTPSPTAPSPAAPAPPTTPPPPTAAAERLTAQSKLTLTGLGPVQIGMTVAAASQAAGTPLVSSSDMPTDPGCSYLKLQDGPENIGFMVVDDQIARIDIWANPNITTPSGAKLGDPEEKILELYGDQIEVSPHPYGDGSGRAHYLTFMPRDAGDRNYRLIFETDNDGRVVQLRAGRLPEVSWIEGCL